MIERLDRGRLASLVRSRAELLDQSDNPFATAAWVSHFLEQVARDDWTFWSAQIPGRGQMLLHASAQTPTAARALNNYYASQFSPLAGASDSQCQSDMLGLARALRATRPALSTIDMLPMSHDDANAVLDAFKAAGWLTRRYACFGNWYLPCDGLGFDSYMASRPSQTVNTWSRKAKKFKPGGEARLQLVTDPADVGTAMTAYDAVYAKSWKQAEPYPHFVSGWAAECARRGWLRLGVAWMGEAPIAAQFWFVHRRRAYIFKLAYDEAFSKLSAGTVLSAFMFRQALEVDKVIEIDYLTGDDPYKQAWMTQRRERFGVIAGNPQTIRGATRGLLELLGAARQRLRRAPPPSDRVAGEA